MTERGPLETAGPDIAMEEGMGRSRGRRAAALLTSSASTPVIGLAMREASRGSFP
jgi:hypothetical protein